MITEKKGKGYYMKSLPPEKRSEIMSERAMSRWEKTSVKDRKKIGKMLTTARKNAKQTS